MSDYREKVRPSFGIWALAVFAALSIAIAVGAAFGGNSDLIALAISFVFFGRGLVRSTVTITVDSENLRVDGAVLPLKYVGKVQALDVEATRRMRGPESDPAAYMVLRGWVKTAVIVENTDSDDPVPYWFISTRKPEKLAKALN